MASTEPNTGKIAGGGGGGGVGGKSPAACLREKNDLHAIRTVKSEEGIRNTR